VRSASLLGHPRFKKTVQMQSLHPKIKFVFTRERHVQRGDFSSLVEAFNPNDIGQLGLRKYCNSIQILFHGYCAKCLKPNGARGAMGVRRNVGHPGKVSIGTSRDRINHSYYYCRTDQVREIKQCGQLMVAAVELDFFGLVASQSPAELVLAATAPLDQAALGAKRRELRELEHRAACLRACIGKPGLKDEETCADLAACNTQRDALTSQIDKLLQQSYAETATARSWVDMGALINKDIVLTGEIVDKAAEFDRAVMAQLRDQAMRKKLAAMTPTLVRGLVIDTEQQAYACLNHEGKQGPWRQVGDLVKALEYNRESGWKMTPDWRVNIGKASKRAWDKATPEQRAKQLAGLRKTKWTKARLAKRVATFKANRTPAQRARRSTSLKAAWERRRNNPTELAAFKARQSARTKAVYEKKKSLVAARAHHISDARAA